MTTMMMMMVVVMVVSSWPLVSLSRWGRSLGVHTFSSCLPLILARSMSYLVYILASGIGDWN